MLSYLKKVLKRTAYKSYLNQKGSFIYYAEKVFFPKNSTTFKLAIREGIYEHEILKFLLNNIKDNSGNLFAENLIAFNHSVINPEKISPE